jgi:hypothetical protein
MNLGIRQVGILTHFINQIYSYEAEVFQTQITYIMWQKLIVEPEHYEIYFMTRIDRHNLFPFKLCSPKFGGTSIHRVMGLVSCEWVVFVTIALRQEYVITFHAK